jgi:hypothetical protein
MIDSMFDELNFENDLKSGAIVENIAKAKLF